jgi:hypothetical protein
MDPREEIAIAAQFATGLTAELRDVDASWQDRSRKNMANKLDVRSVISGIVNTNLPPDNIPPSAPPPPAGTPYALPIPVLPQARGDAPLPIPMEMTNDILAGRIPQVNRGYVPGMPQQPLPPGPIPPNFQPPIPNTPPIDDKQLMFELNLNAKDPRKFVYVNELASHLEDRLDKIEDELKMIMSFIVDIRRNTTKRYKKNIDESESTTRSSTEEQE